MGLLVTLYLFSQGLGTLIPIRLVWGDWNRLGRSLWSLCRRLGPPCHPGRGSREDTLYVVTSFSPSFRSVPVS